MSPQRTSGSRSCPRFTTSKSPGQGRIGGNKLAKLPERIKVSAILRALEEDFTLALAGEWAQAFHHKPDKSCPTVAFWTKMEKMFCEALEEAPRRPPLKVPSF